MKGVLSDLLVLLFITVNVCKFKFVELEVL